MQKWVEERMRSGLALVQAHIDSFIAGRSQDYPQQLAADFRHTALPPVIGEGPTQARRWRDMLFSIYRQWSAVIEDACDNGDEVVCRITLRGTEPLDPATTPPVFEEGALVRWVIVRGRIASSSALYRDGTDEHLPKGLGFN